MNNIHLVALKRLFFGWLLVSLLVGSGAWWYGVQQINQQVLAMAEQGVDLIAPEVLKRVNGTPMDLMALQIQASEYRTLGFVSVELYNRQGQLVVQKSTLEGKRIDTLLGLRASKTLTPNKRTQSQRIALDNTEVIRVLVPLLEQDELAGHFIGIYLVPENRLHALGQQTRNLLLTLTGVVLLTTLLLYPFIISLQRKVQIEAQVILRGNMDLMKVLGSAVAKRDSDTNSHNFRVTLYAVRLAEAIGMQRNQMKELIAGAFLHDVGKIGIPDAILQKPGPLTPTEFATMKRHVDLGLEIISHSPWLKHARDVVAHHHEKFDGSGYPEGIAKTAIPLTARVFALADVFDALTSVRPYKVAFALEESLQQLQAGAGSHFDPQLLDTFLGIAPELHARFSAIDDQEQERNLEIVVSRYWHSPHNGLAHQPA